MASTPTPDRVKDIINPLGLKARGPVPLLLNHKSDQPVGEVRFGSPTVRGLPFTARIAKVTNPGTLKDRCDEAWDSVKNGVIKGVSIGFIPSESNPLPNGGTHFAKAEVHELSLTATPCNPEAVITSFKSLDTKENTINIHADRKSIEIQVRSALAMSEDDAIFKAAVAASGTDNTPALYYSTQPSDNVVLAPFTRPIIEQLAAMGAPQLPVNTRVLTQGVQVEAVQVPAGTPYPAIAPSLAVALQGNTKYGVILGFSRDLVGVAAPDQNVVEYVTGQCEIATGLAVDDFLVNLITGQGAAVATVAAAIANFAGDLRTACWVAAPATLAALRTAVETQVTPRGGSYVGLPALSSLKVPAGKLLLVDVARTAIFAAGTEIERTTSANIMWSSAPGTDGIAPSSTFQQGLVALKATRYADASLMHTPCVVSLS